MAAGPGGVREGVFKNFSACHQCDADCWNGFLDTTYQAIDVTLHALLRCFLQIIWRSNEP
jgi:hypothetical protein